MQCDLCSRPISGGQYTRFTSSQMRQAAGGGLRPPEDPTLAALGMGGSAMHGQWLTQVQNDTTDWAICPGCKPKVDRYL